VLSAADTLFDRLLPRPDGKGDAFAPAGLDYLRQILAQASAQ